MWVKVSAAVLAGVVVFLGFVVFTAPEVTQRGTFACPVCACEIEDTEGNLMGLDFAGRPTYTGPKIYIESEGR